MDIIENFAAVCTGGEINVLFTFTSHGLIGAMTSFSFATFANLW